MHRSALLGITVVCLAYRYLLESTSETQHTSSTRESEEGCAADRDISIVILVCRQAFRGDDSRDACEVIGDSDGCPVG